MVVGTVSAIVSIVEVILVFLDDPERVLEVDEVLVLDEDVLRVVTVLTGAVDDVDLDLPVDLDLDEDDVE